MSDEHSLSEELLDFYREILSVGAGNAATIFSLMLECIVNVEVPEVKVMSKKEMSSSAFISASQLLSITMAMVGDIKGEILFMMKEEQKAFLMKLMESSWTKIPAMYSHGEKLEEWHKSLLEEMGNVFAATYMRIINKFCGMNIYHSVPRIYTGSFDQIVGKLKGDNGIVSRIIITIMETPVEVYFVTILSGEFLGKLAEAIKMAKEKMKG